MERSNDEKKEEGAPPLPVSILSGFLGSGKTTLLKHILESSQHKMKIAVIVNDMAELNIDAALVQSSVTQAEREIVSLQNGCICCTLRGDLIREIATIRKSNQFEYVIIESTGIAEPMQVAQAFLYDPNTEQLAPNQEDMLWKTARLDTCVTVVDAANFYNHLQNLEQFADKYNDGVDLSTPDGVAEGQKSISTLLMEQVEFANVIVMNKMDLVEESQVERLTKVLRKLNATAKLIPTEFCKLELSNIMNTHLFDMDEASRAPGWLVALKEAEHSSEADEYGVSSFVYRSRTPMHGHRLLMWMDKILHFAHEWKELDTTKRQAASDEKMQYMEEHYGTILRSKGFCWVAGKDTFMFGFALSGRIGGFHGIMPWYTVLPPDQWNLEGDDLALVQSKFEQPHGDRRQEIVFIGQNLKTEAITKALDQCLLTKKELKHYSFYSDDGYPATGKKASSEAQK